MRVAVADDHPTLLAGLEHLLSLIEDVVLVGMVADSTALVDLLGASPCDVVVMDFSMPNGRYGDGLSLLGFLKRRFPTCRVVVLTSIENPAIMQGIYSVGGVGILSKSDDLEHIEPALRMAHAGQRYISPTVLRILEHASQEATASVEPRLSKREAEVLRLYAEGLSVGEIGARAGRSAKTISAQKMAAMKKLGLKHDADIYKYALANGLVQAPQVSRRETPEADKDA